MLYVTYNLGGALAQVGPFVRRFEETVLASSLSTPYHTRRGTAGVEAGVGQVSLVGGTELAMDFGTGLYASRVHSSVSICMAAVHMPRNAQ